MRFDRLKVRLAENVPGNVPPYAINDLGQTIEVVASADIAPGTDLGEYSIPGPEGKPSLTQLGQYLSRSENPNCAIDDSSGRPVVRSLMPIAAGTVLTVNYEGDAVPRDAAGDGACLTVELGAEEAEMANRAIADRVGFRISSAGCPECEAGSVVMLSPIGELAGVLDNDGNTMGLVGYVPPPQDVPGFPTPADMWRSSTGVELLEPDLPVEEVERRWTNWRLMPGPQKEMSDRKCVELFGMSNPQVAETAKTVHLNRKVVPVAVSAWGIPISEELTYYNLRNFLMLLKTKVTRLSTKELIDDVMVALMSMEVRNIPLFRLQQLTIPPRQLPRI